MEKDRAVLVSWRGEEEAQSCDVGLCDKNFTIPMWRNKMEGG